MGMFDKDKEMGLILTDWIGERVEFIVYSVGIVRDDFPTTFGPATQTELEVARLDNPGQKYRVTTLASAIAEKAKEADPEDFPAVVWWSKVPSKRSGDTATVIQFVRPWEGA